MKTAKIILIITLIAFTGLIYAESQNDSRLIKIALEKAIKDPALVKSIYNQVDAAKLLANKRTGLITAIVVHRGNTYQVYGKYEEWVSFFLMDQTQNKTKSLYRLL